MVPDPYIHICGNSQSYGFGFIRTLYVRLRRSFRIGLRRPNSIRSKPIGQVAPNPNLLGFGRTPRRVEAYRVIRGPTQGGRGGFKRIPIRLGLTLLVPTPPCPRYFGVFPISSEMKHRAFSLQFGDGTNKRRQCALELGRLDLFLAVVGNSPYESPTIWVAGDSN